MVWNLNGRWYSISFPTKQEQEQGQEQEQEREQEQEQRPEEVQGEVQGRIKSEDPSIYSHVFLRMNFVEPNISVF